MGVIVGAEEEVLLAGINVGKTSVSDRTGAMAEVFAVDDKSSLASVMICGWLLSAVAKIPASTVNCWSMFKLGSAVGSP